MGRGPRAGASWARPRTLVVLTALLCATVVAGPLVASAIFTDSPGIGGNNFSTTNCFQARFGSRQAGTVANTSNGTQTVAITPVDPAKAFLLFSIRSNGNRPVNSTIRGRLAASGTQLEFARVTDEGAPATINIQWYVVEYACGVRVQRGAAALSAPVVDIPITQVGSLSRAFVTWSYTPEIADLEWDSNDNMLVEFTSTSNLQLRASTSNGTATAWWQVVEFTNAGDALVQRGATSMPGGATSTDVTIPQAVDTDRTFVLVGDQSSGAGPDIGARLLRAQLLDPATIRIDRSISGTPDPITQITWQAVELRDGSRVQRGSANLAGGAATQTAAISAVDTSRATAFASVQTGGGQSVGRTPYNADDVVGVASVTVAVTSATQVTLQRNNTAAAADVGWFVVEWGGPPWWDNAFDFRKVITVTAGTSNAPNGYSVRVTIDHAALVAAGQAQADGDDLRIVRWNGSTWTELDRVLAEGSSWNTATTTLWFKTQAAISAAARDLDYFLYYSNPAASNPPTSRSNVFVFDDGFESGTLSNWTDNSPNTPADWYSSSWGYRKQITLDSARITGSHSNFPVLISVIDADLSARAQSDADDIVFTSSNGLTKLSHEIEKYTSGTGELVAWVKMPTLSPASNRLFMYYGNAAAANQQDPVNVWDASYRGVWHLEESPTGAAPQFDDPSGANNNGTAQGTIAAGAQVAGKIGGSLTLDGTSDYISTAVSSVNPQNLTVEAWIRTASASGRKVVGFESNQTGNGSASGDRHLYVGSTDGRARFGSNDGSNDIALSTAAVNNNAWRHLVGVQDDAANTISIYVDGAFQQSVANANAQNFTGWWRIGAYRLTGWTNGGDGFYPGGIDEVRVSQTVRSAGWISTEYNNMNSPATFHSIGGQETPASWYDTAWQDRKRISLDPWKISGSHSNFPVLVSVTDADLATDAQDDGDDIVFTSVNGTTKLSHQIEKFDGTTGELVAWVKMPTLSATSNVIHVYYGNGAVGSQQDAVNVWDANFRGVWHLNENPTGPAPQFDDPSATNNNGTAQGTIAAGAQVAGKIGGSLNLDGTSDYISTAVSFVNPQNLTLEAWIRTAGASGRKAIGFESNQTGTTSANWDRQIYVGTTDGRARFGSYDGTYDVALSTGAVNDNAWRHVVGVQDDGANTISIYVDGVFQQSIANTNAQNYTGWWRIGSFKTAGWPNGADGYFPGQVDEVRVSNSIRSAGWITTTYNSQNAPSTFHAFGAEQAVPASVFAVASDQTRSGTYSLKVAPHSSVFKWLTADGIDEAGVRMDAWWRVSQLGGMNFAQGVRAGSAGPINQYETNLQDTAGWNIAKVVNGAWNEVVDQPGGQNPQANTWTKVSLLITGQNVKVLRDDTQIVPGSGWTNVGAELASGTVGFRGWNVPVGQNVWIDDVTVRKLVDTEPTTSVGAEDRR